MSLVFLLCVSAGDNPPIFNFYSERPVHLNRAEVEDLSIKVMEHWELIEKEALSPEKFIKPMLYGRWELSFKLVNTEKGEPGIDLNITDSNSGQILHQSFRQENDLAKKFRYTTSYDLNFNASSKIRKRLQGLNSIDPLPETNTAQSSRGNPWGKQEQQTIKDVMELESKVVNHWANIIKEENLTEEQRFKWIDEGRVHIKDSKLGTAEINMIDEQPFIRVIHKNSEITFAIFEKEVDMESTHFKQYIARQHIDAGTGRSDGQSGRDVVTIIKDEKKKSEFTMDPENYRSFKRGKTLISTLWWEDYLRATYKKPTAPTVAFGGVCGLAQGALAMCVAGLNKAIDPSAELSYTPAMLSTAWGSGIGAFISTYKNWTNRGTRIMRTIKSSANSIIFAYALVGLIHPDGFQALTVLDFKGLLLHSTILGNVWANNMSKVYWNDFARVREFMGITRNNYVMKLPFGKRWDTKIARSAVEGQSLYLAPFTIRLLDLTGTTIGYFPIGKFLLWSSIPAVEYGVLRYLEKVAFDTQHPKAIEMATQHRKEWEFKKKFFYDHKMRTLILKRICYWLTFRKSRHKAMKRYLAKEYPDFYQYKSEKKIKRNNKRVEFNIPNRPPMQAKSIRETCSSIMSILLGRD
jgi:hypothetical protein